MRTADSTQFGLEINNNGKHNKTLEGGCRDFSCSKRWERGIWTGDENTIL